MTGYRPPAAQLRGMSFEVAGMYGMPHVGCHYYRDDASATAWDGPYRECAACERTGGAHHKHHEPPRSRSLAVHPATGRKIGGARLLDASANPAWEPPEGEPDDGEPFLLCTRWGKFVLLPALIDLCAECHAKRHSAGTLSIRWEWDADEAAERWWSGWYLSRGKRPHGRWLWALGRYVITIDGKEGEFRLWE